MIRPDSTRDTFPDRHLRAVLLTVCCALALLAAACGKSQPYGQPSSIIVVMPDSIWAQVEDTTYAVLEQRVEAVRQEKKFHVTQVDPGAEHLSQLKLWYQVMVAGPPESELIRQVADAAGVDELSPPQVIAAQSIWSRGQVVRAVVASPGQVAEAWVAHLEDLYRATEESYRQFVRTRMWTSGRDSALADSLAERYGFRLEVPKVYEVTRADSLVIFRNDNPRPADLIRSVTVTWRSPGPDSLTAAYALDWRSAIDSVYYGSPQSITPDSAGVRRFTHRGHQVLAVRGDWADEGPYPAGGPFTLWLVRCGDRTYLVDSWLYSPDPERGKYQYLIQLEWIRQSFRCAGDAPG